MVELAALLIGSITTLLIALVVFARNRKSLTNKLFISLAIGLVGWSVTTYFSVHASNDALTLIWIKLVMFFVIIQNTSFLLLVRVFPERESDIFKQKKYRVIIAFSVVTALVSLSPYLFIDFQDGAPVPGPGMALFLPHALITAVGGVVALFLRFKHSKGTLKNQLQYFLAGTLLIFTLVPLGNFVIPVVFKLNDFVFFSPLYSIVFSGFIAYAIVAKKLFDIRAVVARAAVYLFVIFFVTLAYVVFVNLLRIILMPNLSITTPQLLLNIGITVLLLLIYPSLRSRFDRITSKVFFRDAYDTQTFIDELNKKLVSNSDTEVLLKQSCDLIEENIKSEFVSFFIRDTSYLKSRLVGDYKSNLKESESAELHSLLPRTHTKILYVEDEPVNEAEKKAFEILKANNIDVLVRIVSTLDYEVDGVGYLLLGQKRSGNPYSSQDLRVLEIVGNELEIAVENSLRFEEIEQFNVTLQEKIEGATRELKRSNEKLRALDEAKDEFVSMASHQLRTPLTSIKGYLSMVIEGDVGKVSDTQRKMLGQALFSSQRMVYLISDLLNVSRLKTGKFIIEAKPVYLPDLVQSEVDQLVEGAKAKNITLKFNKPKKLTTIMLDDMKIRQVVMNFVDNAIYYTPSRGKIDVSLKETPKMIEFRVKDTGIGVPKDQLHKLFTKFYRADNARKARPDGTGLGLFMAKKVIVAQGGSILVDSVENKGSTFGFAFPKAKLKVVEKKEDEKPKDDSKN